MIQQGSKTKTKVILSISIPKTIKNNQKQSKTIKNNQKQSKTNQKQIKNNQKQSKTIKSRTQARRWVLFASLSWDQY